MSARHEIRCINKTDRYDPHERIKNVGGVNADETRWRITRRKPSMASRAANGAST